MSDITVAAVYVGGPAPLGDPAFGLVSGIAKTVVPADRSLGLTELNLDGDDQADRTVHGGLDKAVYAYATEHRPAWAVDLDQPALSDPDPVVAPFGENVATIGPTEETVRIGDRWAWGTAVLEVCQPRWPCQKLTVHRAHARVGPLMRATGRTGWYLRVVTPGTVPAAGPITLAAAHPAGITVADAHRAMLDRAVADRGLVEAVAGLGPVLADEWRLPLLDRLA
jgi:MOSC domain-containing protein YiiM